MIAITLDIEWAIDAVIKDTLELLDQSETNATLFSTHDDPFNDTNYERGIHPNFQQGQSVGAILDELCSLFPTARGLRSHRMFIHTPLRLEFVERGIEYESNYMAYKVDNIVPFSMPEGTVQFPVYWMDDVWFRVEGTPIDLEELLRRPGLKVFDFHPPHIYYNTPSLDYYRTNKEGYWEEPSNSKDLRFDGYGVRDVFKALLEFIDTQGVNGNALGNLYEMYRKDAPENWPEAPTPD